MGSPVAGGRGDRPATMDGNGGYTGKKRILSAGVGVSCSSPNSPNGGAPQPTARARSCAGVLLGGQS